MKGIDSKEDELTSKKIEEACEIIEEALSRRGHSMEKLQNVSKARTELLLMTEEILLQSSLLSRHES
ncbi:MAG: hypothetical protein KGD60_07700 [Candidatus Thorarchaeota archaeon]|nr:hypothetical protein [Candidatus Thorarchaeota archaeon]